MGGGGGGGGGVTVQVKKFNLFNTPNYTLLNAPPTGHRLHSLDPSHMYLVSGCLSTAPEHISCISRGVHSKAVCSLTQMEPSIDPTRLSRSLRA